MDDTASKNYLVAAPKFSMHGYVFQLKLLMLFLNRGCRKGYAFHLATEMNAAEKFDDLVFKFTDQNGNQVYRFLQAKHKLDERKKILAVDLLGKNAKGDFHLQKYFQSYRAIKNKDEFCGIVIKDLIICTNITFDFEDLKSGRNLTLRKLEETDAILHHEMTQNKLPGCYKFDNFPDQEKEIFYFSSQLTSLAKIFAECVLKNCPLTLKDKHLHVYHYALVTEKVIDIENKSLHQHFIKGCNLSAETQEFRNLFLKFGLELYTQDTQSESKKIDHETFWSLVEPLKLKLSIGFGRDSVSSASVCTLKNDTVTAEEIEEFLRLLTFAVNQPNENELGEIIQKEMANEFKLTDSGSITDSFYKYMWEWMTNKDGYFLSNLDREKLFEEMKCRWSKLVVAGVTSDNPEKHLINGDFFIDATAIEEFVFAADSETCLLNISTENTAISFIKVVQALKHSPSDSYAAFNLKYMLNSYDNILSAFKFKEPFMLVVEFDVQRISREEVDAIKTLIKNIISILKPGFYQKLILITDLNDAFFQRPFFCDSICKNFADKSFFSDLTTDARDRILQREITFQGQQMCLKELINDRDHFADQILTERVLGHVISGQTLQIGNPLPGLGDTESYYIQRKLKIHMKFTEDCLIDKSPHDLFVISGAVKEDLSKLVGDEAVMDFQASDSDGKHCSIIAIKDSGEATCNSDILNTYPDKNIHWLTCHGNQFLWQQSRDMPNKLDESNLVNDAICHDKIMIIAGGPGIGKTTVLTNLSMMTKKEFQHLWVIRINLVDHTSQLSNLNFSNVDSIIDFICYAENLKQDFDKNLLRLRLKQIGKVVLFLDGFDEICPSYKEEVMDMLQLLKVTKVEKVWVTTRLRYQDELGDRLQVFSYQLIPFSNDDQERFIRNFWIKTLNLKDANEQIIIGYIKELIHHFTMSTDDQIREFIGIPLQARMLAEVYEQQSYYFYIKRQSSCLFPAYTNPFWEQQLQHNAGGRHYQATDNPYDCVPYLAVNQRLSGAGLDLSFQQFHEEACETYDMNFDLLALYAWFIENRYKIYYEEKQKMDFTIPNMDITFKNILCPEMSKKHQALAFNMIFPEKYTLIFRDKTELHGEVEQLAAVGIVQITNGKPSFLHRTFAEYFVAQFLHRILCKKDKNPKRYRLVLEMLKQELFSEENDMIRIFLDQLLAEPSAIHRAVLKGELETIIHILSRRPKNTFSRDRLGRIPLHLAVLYDYKDITGFILKHDINTICCTDFINYGPICYAIASKNSHLTIINLLRKGGVTNKFQNTLQPVMNIIQQRNLCNSQLVRELASNANDTHKAVIVRGVDYIQVFLRSLQKCNYSEIPCIFLLATTDQKREMLTADNYELIKRALANSDYRLLNEISTCLWHQLQEEIFNLQEYKLCFNESVQTQDFKMLEVLTKMTSAKMQKVLWQQTDYKLVFSYAINHLQNDLVLDMLKIFSEEDMFAGVDYIDYFKRMFSEEYKFVRQISTMLGHASAEQQENIFKQLNFIGKFQKAFASNDLSQFQSLLNYFSNDYRKRLLLEIDYIGAFKEAIGKCDRFRLGMFLKCSNMERDNMMKNLDHYDYIPMFKDIIINKDTQLFLTLVDFISDVERDAILKVVDCEAYLNMTIKQRDDHLLKPILKTISNDKQKICLTMFDSQPIIPEGDMEQPWSVWAPLLYVLLKTITTRRAPRSPNYLTRLIYESSLK